VENQSQASSNAKAELVSNIISQVESQTNMGSSSKESGGLLEESNSFSAKSQIKSDLILLGFQEISSPKRLENGLYEFKGYVCNSIAAKPYLDSLSRNLEDLEASLKHEIDEDICVNASKIKYKMLGWQRILEVLNQMDKALQMKYETANGKIKNGCDEIKKTETILVSTKGKEPKNSNALENLGKYVEEYLVNSSLYSAAEKGRAAKFECLVEITENYSSYILTAKIVNISTGKIVKNRMANVESSLKNKDEHKRASMELVNKLLSRCGAMNMGDVYDGDCKNGVREGKGKLTYASGNVYEGDWKADKYNGKGKFTFANGGVYEGELKNGLADGKGKLTYANGDAYEGDWKADKYHGKGKISFANGNSYEGELKDGLADGKGKFISPNNFVYEGDYKADKFHGKGKVVFANGNVYEGEFKNGKADGKGKFTSPDGDVYEGEFKNDFYEGKGKLTGANGDVYEGGFKEGFAEGKGKLVANGSVYEGEFKKHSFNGKGKLVSANGDVYEGEFRNHLYNGKGKLIYANGDIFEGEFKNGKPFGDGKITHKTPSTPNIPKKDNLTLKDTRDGREYRIVEIGAQTWTAENLDYNVADGSACFNGDQANCQKYGRLYDFAGAQKACPAGWHLPSKAEWESLINSVGGANTAGLKLKAVNGSNNYGFLALFGGGYVANKNTFEDMGTNGLWWNSTEADNNNAFVSIISNQSDDIGMIEVNKSNGFSVRCLKSPQAPAAEPLPAPVIVPPPAPVVVPPPAPAVEPPPAPVVVPPPAPVVEPQLAPVAEPQPAPAVEPHPTPAVVEPPPAPIVVPPPEPIVVPPASTATVPQSIPANTPDNSKPASVEKSPVLGYVLGSVLAVGSVVLLYNAYAKKAESNDYLDDYKKLNSGKPMEYDRLRKKSKEANDKVLPFLISGGVLGVSAVGVFIWF